MEFNQEENDEKMNNEEESSEGKVKQWLQDNLRIVISVLIVVLIAGGIYSYSKRTQAPTTSDNTSITGDIATNNGDQTEDTTNSSATTDQANAGTKETTVQEKTSSVATSQETEKTFIETAAKGDGMTKLARKALANYLEKNPDTALTAEHKIYIEDYLRKNVAPQKVAIGTSVEFSKDLINSAIGSSKTLSSKQLQNLHKYAVRVPSLS